MSVSANFRNQDKSLPIPGTFDRFWSSKVSWIVNVPSDQTLIEQCLAGLRDAFGQLVERYRYRFYHGLWHALGSGEDAQDIAQDAFVKAFEKSASFTGQAAF